MAMKAALAFRTSPSGRVRTKPSGACSSAVSSRWFTSEALSGALAVGAALRRSTRIADFSSIRIVTPSVTLASGAGPFGARPLACAVWVEAHGQRLRSARLSHAAEQTLGGNPVVRVQQIDDGHAQSPASLLDQFERGRIGFRRWRRLCASTTISGSGAVWNRPR